MEVLSSKKANTSNTILSYTKLEKCCFMIFNTQFMFSTVIQIRKCLPLLIFVFLCFSSFLSCRDTSQALPCSPAAPRLPVCLAVPDSRCSTIFFCDFTEPKSTKTDSSGCCTSAPLSPLSLVTPRCLPQWSSPPSFLPSNFTQPEAFVPPPHLCVSGVLIWSWCCCSATWTHSKISHANTHVHKNKKETHQHSAHTWNTHMQYMPLRHWLALWANESQLGEMRFWVWTITQCATEARHERVDELQSVHLCTSVSSCMCVHV